MSRFLLSLKVDAVEGACFGDPAAGAQQERNQRAWCGGREGCRGQRGDRLGESGNYPLDTSKCGGA